MNYNNAWIAMIGKQVHIDDTKFVYTVTGVMFRIDNINIEPQIECSYFNDAAPHSTWVEGWRITVIT